MWEFDMMWLAMAFCGGIFGAAVGALPSFVFCGFGAILAGAVGMVDEGMATQINLWVTWGPLVGPQCAFAGGCCAAIYAKRIGVHENGRDICTALMGLRRPDVLLVGGIFGAIGALVTLGVWKIGGFNHAVAGNVQWGNEIAWGVAITMMLGRLAFGQTGLFGKVSSGVRRWVGNENACWLPWQHDIGMIMLIAIAVALPSAVLAEKFPQTNFLIFGICTIVFAFMVLGMKVPAMHHFAITAFFATSMTGDVAWGVAAAVTVGFVCEICAFLFTAHGDSHIDPPTLAIGIVGLLQSLLIYLGVMTPKSGNTIEGIIALAVVIVAMPLLLTGLRKLPAKA